QRQHRVGHGALRARRHHKRRRIRRRLVEVDHHGVPVAAHAVRHRLRQREAGWPSDSAASIETPAIGLFALATTELATSLAATFLKSSSTVSGSGLVAVYATGSVASMTSDAP